MLDRARIQKATESHNVPGGAALITAIRESYRSSRVVHSRLEDDNWSRPLAHHFADFCPPTGEVRIGRSPRVVLRSEIILVSGRLGQS